MRSLSPLPRTCTRPASIARSPVESAVTSETRSPPAYSNSRIARRATSSLALADGSLPCRPAPASPSLPARPATSAAPSRLWATRYLPWDRDGFCGPAAATCRTHANSSACAPPSANQYVRPQMFKECRHILLRAVSRTHAGSPGIRQTSSNRTRTPRRSTGAAPFHAQIRLVVIQERQIARGVHRSNYPRLRLLSTAAVHFQNLLRHGLKISNKNDLKNSAASASGSNSAPAPRPRAGCPTQRVFCDGWES